MALSGPFLYSANSPSKTLSRYAVYGQKVVQDAAVIAQFTGNPTDITVRDGIAAVVDAGAGTTRAGVPFGAPSPVRTRDPRRMNLRWKAPSPPARDASQRRTEDA